MTTDDGSIEAGFERVLQGLTEGLHPPPHPEARQFLRRFYLLGAGDLLNRLPRPGDGDFNQKYAARREAAEQELVNFLIGELDAAMARLRV